MPDRWVNAVYEVTVPMRNVSVDASAQEKQDAVAAVLEEVADRLEGMDEVIAGRWEDVEDGEPIASKGKDAD